MKYILTLIFVAFFLVSCWDSEPWLVEESVQIVDTYIETLDSSVQDARQAAELINERQKVIEESLNTN